MKMYFSDYQTSESETYISPILYGVFLWLKVGFANMTSWQRSCWMQKWDDIDLDFYKYV